MSKSNIEKVIEKILFDDQALSKFLACKDQNDLYKYCLNKGSGYTREEFDEFVEETIVKANKEKEVVASSLNLKKEIFDFLIAKANKEVVASSLKDVGGSQASHGISKKIRQAFTKVLAAGLAVFSAVPMVQNFVPEAKANHVEEKGNNVEVMKNRKNVNVKSESKKLSTGKKVGITLGALGTAALATLLISKAIPGKVNKAAIPNGLQSPSQTASRRSAELNNFCKLSYVGTKNDGTLEINNSSVIGSKVTLIGNEKAGKTCLIEALLGQNFNENYKATFGARYKVLDKKESKLSLITHDISGQEMFKNSLSFCYKFSKIVLLTVSAGNLSQDIEIASNFFNSALEICPKAAFAVVVTQCDTDKVNKVSSSTELRDFCTKIKNNSENVTILMPNNEEFFKTSAKDNTGITELKEALFAVGGLKGFSS